MKRRLAQVLAAGILASGLTASADEGAPIGVCGGAVAECQGLGGDDTFEVSAGGQQAGQGGGTQGQAVDLPDRYSVYDYAPACTGNDRLNAELLCEAAVTACAASGQGYINYWRWQATVLRATREVLSPPGWVKLDGSVCLGPQADGVPLLAAIAGVVAGDFQELVVLKGAAISDPRGTTLVNYETGFHTDAKTYVLEPVTILGHRVVLTARPERYDWHFGDGTVLEDGGPGAPGTLQVSHTYAKTATVAPYVVVTWSGTFSVDGGPQQPVVGTAVTTGPGTPLQVREARSQLVSGNK